MHEYRSHNCGALRAENLDQTVRLSGWVHRKRDHGGLLFIDLRDHFGLTQLVIEPSSPFFAVAEGARPESVLRAEGKVVARDADAKNPNLPTGDVEIYVSKLEVLSEANDLPLPVFGEPDYPEDIRLRYRFLDLRRETLHSNIVLRSDIIAWLRRRMTDDGFREYQTPILTASSPEGARDFLVPSRTHPGRFYALPQAPQQFKQMLMVAGFDRYFQIAPCFRDEDARADRSPGEFYQLDLEMSFVTQEDVFQAVEPVLHDVFVEFGKGKRVTETFPRIPYAEAMQKYGSDKPDLRIPIEMEDVTASFAGSNFKIFAGMIEKNDKVRVWAIPAKTGGSRAFCDRMNSWAQGEGQPGLGYIFFRDGEGAGPLAKNIGAERTEQIRTQLGLEDGDAVFFCAGVPREFAEFAGRARNRVGTELDLMDSDQFAFCWIVDFPMYEIDETTGKLDFSHNPFSMPQGGMEALESMDPLDIKGYQYDIVCNGIELSSGAIRNHKPEIMLKAFELAGYDDAVVEKEFGGMLNAFRFGAPPHGGIAPGVDRIVMMLAEQENLREVVAFPMNQQAEDLLMQAPSPVSNAQLRELHIRLNLPAPTPEGKAGDSE
tara:strand:- start:2256 stop:4058 length:1803 start_codon:yes stop_codon:yes gene_type:complete